MLTSNRAVLRMLGQCLLFAVVLATWSPKVFSQVWGAVDLFKYNIENVTVTPGAPGSWTVKVIFSVTNPLTGDTWDIKHAVPFQTPGGLTLDIGWDPMTDSDFTNTGSANRLLSPVFPGLTPLGALALGTGAAMPVQVRGLQGAATACVDNASLCPGVDSTLPNRYRVARSGTPVTIIKPVTTGRVAIEGKPVCIGVPGYSCPDPATLPSPPNLNIPVPSAVASFKFTATESLAAMIPDPRRKIVDIAKCQQCHDNKPHGATVVPKLSLHGNNRTENLGLCVVCHNPNQTDVPYRYAAADSRIAGPEVPIDFKVLVHSIHAGGFRVNPYVVIGFQSSVNDFSYVRFPRELRDCTNCHIKEAGKWTFELPLRPGVLGTTRNTGSGKNADGSACNYLTTPRCVDVDPANDVKISPTAAVCSSCHDKAEVQSHMIRTGGASFSTTQGATVVERCASCHGPGKEEDVLRAHEISTQGSVSSETSTRRTGGSD